ncbi:UPF0223 family protein [Salinicoccus jeotgali]|uniref:UPF0223 family protein n=1 Tax=Salinicoccus jeotgali TaxID=381634 RepID=A0ABP7EE41_9STAP
MENYSYPLDEDWTTDEIINAVLFFEAVEKAYDTGVPKEELEMKYDAFKLIVPGKSQEKTKFREFKSNSGLEAYSAVKKLKDAEPGSLIKI